MRAGAWDHLRDRAGRGRGELLGLAVLMRGLRLRSRSQSSSLQSSFAFSGSMARLRVIRKDRWQLRSFFPLPQGQGS